MNRKTGYRRPSRFRGRFVLSAIAAVGLVLAPASASQAAVATWYSSSATEWSTYSESSYSYNTYSRTGQYVEVVGASGGMASLVHTKLWFGSYYTDGWTDTRSIGGPRTFGSTGKGQFAFHWAGANPTYNTYDLLARATDVRLVGASRMADPNPEQQQLTADDLFALETPASDYGVRSVDFNLLATDGDTRLLTAKGDGMTVFTVLTSDSIAFSTKLTDLEFGQRAAALHVGNPEVGLDAQYVFVDDAHRADAEALGGLLEIGPGVFVDLQVKNRTAFDPQQSRTAGGYMIPVGPVDLG